MMAEVLQHISDCIGDFAASLQYVGMVSVEEDLSLRAANWFRVLARRTEKPWMARGSMDRIVDFNDRVQVIALDGVVHDAHSEVVLDLAQRLLDGAHAAEGTQKADAGQEAQGDMHRIPRSERGTPEVGHAWLVSVRLAPCILPLATPRR